MEPSPRPTPAHLFGLTGGIWGQDVSSQIAPVAPSLTPPSAIIGWTGWGAHKDEASRGLNPTSPPCGKLDPGIPSGALIILYNKT